MKKRIVVLLLVVVGCLFYWRRRAADPELLYNRVWLDHMPQKRTEMVDVFAALTREPVGVFDTRSSFKGSWELFRHEPRGDGAIELFFPQSQRKERASYRAWACSEKGFDYCLELKSSRGRGRYFSRKGWEIRAGTAGELDERLRALDQAMRPRG